MPRIVAVGRLVETHGFGDLVRACHLLSQRGGEFQCVIAGGGPEEEGLRELIARLGLKDRVPLSGEDVPEEELPALLRSARVVVLPCVRDRSGDMDGLPRS